MCVQTPNSNFYRIYSFFSVQDEAKTRPLILISGYIHDVSKFFDQHPGGIPILEANIGKDATTAFFGGYYGHSNAAQNVSALEFSTQSIKVTAILPVAVDDACWCVGWRRRDY